MYLPPSILKIFHQLDLMQHTLKYFYLLQRKLVIFDPSYRRDFRGFCINKVGRDPPLNLTLSIMKQEGHKIGVKTVARALNKEYLVNKLNIFL